MKAQARPCANCPWRKDAPPGEFSIERFRELARCAEDQSIVIFQCHKTERPVACAGFLEQGAAHNLSVRLAAARGSLDLKADRSGGLELHENYRSMAIAQGIAPDDPSLRNIRDDTGRWK